MDIESLLKLVSSLGLGITLVLGLWYALLVPRKGKNATGQDIPRASLLVPGWKHDQDLDEARAETERTRLFYQTALKDEQDRAKQRISEWRALREEALAQHAEANADAHRLVELLTNASKDIAVLLEIQRVAQRDGASDAKAH